MPEAEVVQVAPVKSGKTTSSFFITLVGIGVTSLPGILQCVIAIAEQNAEKVPENSRLSFALPVMIAIGYQVTRYLTTNGERQATAKVAEAQSTAIVAQINADKPLCDTSELSEATSAATSTAPLDGLFFNPFGALDDSAKDAEADTVGGITRDELSKKIDHLTGKFDEFLTKMEQ